MSDHNNTYTENDNTKPKRYRRRRRRRPRNKNNEEEDQPMFNNEKDYPPLQVNSKPTYASTAKNWGRCDDPKKLMINNSTQHSRQNISMFLPSGSSSNTIGRYTSPSVTIFTRAFAGHKELEQFPYFLV